MIELSTLFILLNNSWILGHFIYLKSEKGTPFARGELEVYTLSVAWNRLLYFHWLIRELVTSTATATKTSLKKWSRAASNFIAFILSPLMRQMLAIFSLVEFLKTVSKFKKKKGRCLVFTSSTKREIRHFHVIVVQCRQRNARAELVLPI